MFSKNDSGFDKTYIVYFFLISIVHILKNNYIMKFVFSQEMMDMNLEREKYIKHHEVLCDYTYQTPLLSLFDHLKLPVQC